MRDKGSLIAGGSLAPGRTRVLINVTPLHTGQAGVARYVRGLIRGLKTMADEVSVFELGWPVRNFDKPQPMRAMVTAWRDFVWKTTVPRWTCARLRPEVVHDTASWGLGPLEGVGRVATVHDAAVLRHPERFRPWQRRSALAALTAAKSCDRIIAISRFTADEIIALAGFDPKKIEVVHNGCDFGADAVEAAPEASGLPERFFLFVGSLEPGKNLSLLKQTYELAASQGVRLPDLVVVGARWEGVPGEGAPPPGWHYLGHLPDAELVWLYRRAVSLVFPSKYEGFGLPVVEAMILGCPVLCSPVASLREVGGDVAVYAELTPESYFRQMVELNRDEAARIQLAERGIGQAGRFSWTRCASETVQVYADAVR
jgi:glycosyltransferase involved in cell wall biosynthesis